MTKIRVTIDLDSAKDSMQSHLEEQGMEVGVHNCDKDGAYHMWYGERTNLVSFEDVEVLEK
jgi:hypothetical protein